MVGRDEVHVWRASLDEPGPRIDAFLQTLGVDERARARRFHFQRDRDRFITAHGVLRAILGHYLNRPPERLAFRYGPQGKPVLAGDDADSELHFNMTHSGGLGLFAVARGRKVGIDVEVIRDDVGVDQIAERFFSHAEAATLRTLPAHRRRYAFFLAWTRKEAYIKARSEGLSRPLDQFEVSLIPGEPAVLLSTRPDPGEALRWSLKELTVDPGHVAAVAFEGRGCSVSCWQWSSIAVCDLTVP
jgi:4'-phosphopantetheinyl transferase